MACAIKRIVQFKVPIQFGKVKVFDTQENDVTDTCMFCWSNDSVCWTNWVNYKSYLKLAKNIESDFYLRILISTSLGKISINDMFTTCYSVCLEQKNPFLEDFCGQENLFNPYANLDCALQLQQQLSDSIVCMFGIPIYYFRVSPNKETADYTFKEYVMHNVVDVKQIQLMIPDGTMPSSKPTFSDQDYDWEVDWDVELGKAQFAKAFGDTIFPKQRDFIYVPMQKRMWEVNSAYDEKNEGLLWHSTTWKLGLIKWQEKSNVDQGDFDEMIDKLVINKYEDIFGELETNEQLRTSGVAQAEMPKYSANNISSVFLEDAIRKEFTKDTIQISPIQYNNKSIVVSKNIYQFNYPDPKKEQTTLLTYQKGYCGEDATFSFIINTNSIQLEEKNTLFSFGNIEIKSDGKRIYLDDASASLLKTYDNTTATIYLVICKWNRKNFVKEIYAYPYKEPQNIPAYNRRPEMNYFDFDVIEPEENDITPNIKSYNNDYISSKQQEVKVTAQPFAITNVKLFNTYFDKENAIKECLKYTTTNKNCIINDIARPLDSGPGYTVR